jgi:CDP-diacylglycerol--glycerol-3-phosphate 3-phosphatidyltransferase
MQKIRKIIPSFLTALRFWICLYWLISISIGNPYPSPIYLYAALLGILSDFLDGYFARRFQVESEWGAFLDPIADKFLTSLILMTFLYWSWLPLWPVALLILRDLYIQALRTWAAQKQKILSVDRWGKLKTAYLCLLIVCHLFIGIFANPLLVEYDKITLSLYLLAGILSWGSSLNYTRECFHNFLTKTPQVLSNDRLP